MVIILGVESTAHTFGVSVVKDGKILSNVKDSYTTKSGGLIPLEVKKHHENIANKIYEEALNKANILDKEINAISFSNAPGLAPCLIAGMNFVKEKVKELKVSIIPVNHCIAHLEIGETVGAKDPVMLYASGANTQIIAYESNKYRVFGETLDLGVGNFIDTIARYANLGFPGGPKIQELANKSNNLIELPYTIKGMDISFSGLQTKIKELLDKKYPLEDISFSLQETVFAMLVEASERALAHTGKKELLLGGGVACNTRLKQMCKEMCDKRNVKFFCPDNSLLVDNAGMIAYLGWKMFKKKIYYSIQDLNKIDINPKQRTDQVNVNWK